MRDYLEELLEEQAREQEEDSPEALLPAASGPIRRRGTAGGGQAPAGRRGEETSGLQKYGGKVRPAPEEAAPGRGGTAAEPLLAELWPGERAVLGVPAVERGTPPGDREEMYRQAAENGGTENRGEERELPELWGAWDSRTVKGALPPAAVPRRFPPEDGGAWLYRELRQGAPDGRPAAGPGRNSRSSPPEACSPRRSWTGPWSGTPGGMTGDLPCSRCD